MPATKSLKASEKQAILKKLVTEMKKRYGGSVPKQSRPTLETLLFAACLEDSTHESAEAAFGRLLDFFFDLNEVRVSSVTQIEEVLGEIEDADWKAMRIRDALQHTFEKYYSFDLDPLKRKNLDVALKEFEEIPHQSSFIRLYAIHHALGAHVLPIDTSMNRVLIWLGLAEPGSTPEASSEDLKTAVKKSEGALLCHLLKCVATDPKLQPAFEEFDEEELPEPKRAPQRLAELFKGGAKRKTSRSKKAKKAVSRKKPAKKTSTRQSSPKKKTAKKVAKKKPVAKKKTTRKSAK